MASTTNNKTSFQSLPQELRDIVYGHYLEGKILPARVFCLRMVSTSNQGTQNMGSSRPQNSSSGPGRWTNHWHWRVEKPKWHWRACVAEELDVGRRHDLQHHDHALAGTRISMAREYLKVVQSRCPLQIEVDDEFLQPANPLWDAWVDFSTQGRSR